MTLRMAEEVTILREIVPLPPYNLFRQAVLLSAGLEAGHGPGQSRLGVVILVDALLLTQTFLGPLPGGLGPLAVDLLRVLGQACLLFTSPRPRDLEESRMPSSA